MMNSMFEIILLVNEFATGMMTHCFAYPALAGH